MAKYRPLYQQKNLQLLKKNLAGLKKNIKKDGMTFAEMQLSGTQITLHSFVNATEGYDDMFDNKDIYGRKAYTPLSLF